MLPNLQKVDAEVVHQETVLFTKKSNMKKNTMKKEGEEKPLQQLQSHTVMKRFIFVQRLFSWHYSC